MANQKLTQEQYLAIPEVAAMLAKQKEVEMTKHDLRSKQEQIREGIKKILMSKGYGYNWETAEDCMLRINRIKTDQILHLLDSQGVVIKVADTTQDIAGFNHPNIVAVESLLG